MATSSTTAGFLIPTDAPAEDDDLDDILHTTLAGITGLEDNLVRPRWQPEPAQTPELGDNWVAFGIVDRQKDQTSYDSFGTEGQRVERDELLTVLHSFYGRQAGKYLNRYRDGLMLGQNRDQLFAQNMAVVEIQDAVTVPALLANIWVRRLDLRVIFRRRASSLYPVSSIQSVEVGLNNEQYITDITISNN